MTTPATFTPNSDPFSNPTGQNIFVEAQRNQAQPGTTMAGGQVPDTAMPNGMPQQPTHPADQPMTNSMTGGGQPQMGQQPAQGGSPLDNFVPAADNGTNGSPQQSVQGGEPVTGDTPKSVFDSNIDAYKKLAEKQNYSAALTPEVMQQIMSGDVQALSALLNSVGQQAFTNAAYSATRIAGAGFNQNLQQFQSNVLPGVLKDNNFQQAFESNDHAILKHPAVAPLVQMQTQQFRNQFPNANPNEIQQKVVEFFNTVGSAFVGHNEAAAPANAATGVEGAEQVTDLETLFSLG